MFHSFSRKVFLAFFLILGLSLSSITASQAITSSSDVIPVDFGALYDAKVQDFVKKTQNKPLLSSQFGGAIAYYDPNGSSKTTIAYGEGNKVTTVCKPPKPNGVLTCYGQQSKGDKWSKSVSNVNDFTFDGETGLAAGLQASTWMLVSIVLSEESKPTNVVMQTVGDSLILSADVVDNNGEPLSFTLTVVSNSTMFKVDATTTDSFGETKSENLIDYKVTKKQNIKFPSKKNIAK